MLSKARARILDCIIKQVDTYYILRLEYKHGDPIHILNCKCKLHTNCISLLAAVFHSNARWYFTHQAAFGVSSQATTTLLIALSFGSRLSSLLIFCSVLHETSRICSFL